MEPAPQYELVVSTQTTALYLLTKVSIAFVSSSEKRLCAPIHIAIFFCGSNFGQSLSKGDTRLITRTGGNTSVLNVGMRDVSRFIWTGPPPSRVSSNKALLTLSMQSSSSILVWGVGICTLYRTVSLGCTDLSNICGRRFPSVPSRWIDVSARMGNFL